MQTVDKVLVVVGVGGALYFLTRSGALQAFGLSPDAARVQAQASRDSAPGNSPITPASATTRIAGIAGVAGSVATTIAGLSGGGSAAIGGGSAGATAGGLSTLATATIVGGVVVAVFFTYKWLKQRESIATNRARDQWTRQFTALNAALGLPPAANDPQGGQAMAQVIYHLDHDDTHALYYRLVKATNETVFEGAARTIDLFLTGRGIPVTDAA